MIKKLDLIRGQVKFIACISKYIVVSCKNSTHRSVHSPCDWYVESLLYPLGLEENRN